MIDFQIPHRRLSGQQLGVAGKIFYSLFLLIFIAAGVFVARDMGQKIFKSLSTRGWEITNCDIAAGEIPEQAPYTADVVYKYPFCGQMYQSSVISDGYAGSWDYYDAQKILDQYPIGSATVCRVNPAKPAEAVLRTPSLWILLQFLFPMFFITIGSGLIFAIWQPSHSRAGPVCFKHPSVLLAIFCGLIFLVGMMMLGFALSMVLRYRSAQSWPAIPCTVIRTSVGSHTSQGKHNSTYSVDVLYRYTFGGNQFDSSRYKLVSDSSGGYTGKKTVSDNLNQNRLQCCYVNPLDPADAVLNRGFDFVILVLGAFATVMLGFGGAGLSIVVKSRPLGRRA